MKKKACLLLVLLFAMFLMVSPALASDITLEINGQIVQPDVDPVIENGTTLVPLRIVSENLGADVAWNPSTRQVSIQGNGTDILLTVDKRDVLVNGKQQTMRIAPKIIQSRTMVPIRFVSENLGVFVNWDDATRTVQISKDGHFEKPQGSGKELKVTFLDVGQADSALLTCDGHAMLIDGGNVGDSQLIYTVLKNRGIRHLDAVIVTHAHEDHCGGIPAALRACTAGKVYAPVTHYNSRAFTNITKMTTLTVPKPGTTFLLGSAKVQILGPTRTYQEPNNTSIVCKVTNGKDAFLFTGDMELEAEQDLIRSGANLRADVLKVGHHGSETSSGYVFLREVMPKKAVISCGKGNSYGHPDEVVLSRLRDARSQIYRTDLQGDITMTTRGNGISVSVSRNPNADVMVPGGSGVKPNHPTDPDQSVNPPKPSGGNGTYIGNVQSGIFHRTTCSSLPGEQNRIYFSTRDQAVRDGYRPCKRCNP